LGIIFRNIKYTISMMTCKLVQEFVLAPGIKQYVGK